MRKIPQLTDIDSDQQNSGLQARLVYDRQTAARLGITPQLLDTTLYNAFGQSQVSTMYTTLNQYHVVMEVAPQFWQNPQGLNYIYVKSTNGGVVPLSAVAHFEQKIAPLAVNHQGQFPSVTVSFNLAPGVALSDADAVIRQAESDIGLPSSIRGMYSGTLQAFQASLATEPLLITTALLAVYIVLGILYESYIHPITILSTLPSAGVGAVLALMIFHEDLSVIALIGIILLIGLVKKNAILMIDFALAAQRNEHKSPKEAILRGLPAAVPAHPDDHHGGAAGRPAAGVGQRHRLGIAPPSGNYDYRRPDLQPDADAFHYSGGLPLHGPARRMATTRAPAPTARGAPSGRLSCAPL